MQVFERDWIFIPDVPSVHFWNEKARGSLARIAESKSGTLHGRDIWAVRMDIYVDMGIYGRLQEYGYGYRYMDIGIQGYEDIWEGPRVTSHVGWVAWDRDSEWHSYLGISLGPGESKKQPLITFSSAVRPVLMPPVISRKYNCPLGMPGNKVDLEIGLIGNSSWHILGAGKMKANKTKNL